MLLQICTVLQKGKKNQDDDDDDADADDDADDEVLYQTESLGNKKKVQITL